MVRLICGDCTKELIKIKNGSVDLCVTDPPYKVITGGITSGFSHGTGNIFQKSGDGLLFKYNDISVKEWASILFSKLKDRTHLYVFVNSLNIEEFIRELRFVGFLHQNVLVWKKNNKNTSRSYMKDCEYILFFRKGKHKTINHPSTPTVLEFKNPKPKQHPTQKPVDLLSILIKNSSLEGETVLDLFMGSGSTGVAAKSLNRCFIGIEKDPEYFSIAQTRIDSTRTNPYSVDSYQESFVY